MKTPAISYEMTSAGTAQSYPPDSAIGQIQAALLAGERLTSLDALRRFGSSRLAAVIHKLKRDGMQIDSEMVAVQTDHGKTANVSCYSARAT